MTQVVAVYRRLLAFAHFHCNSCWFFLVPEKLACAALIAPNCSLKAAVFRRIFLLKI
jgi:hypothetical protein